MLSIENEIYDAINMLGIDRMPTVQELRSIDRQNLEYRISKSGGFVFWADKLNLAKKQNIVKYSEEQIKEEIYRIIECIKEKRMPSRSEILNNSADKWSLHNKIVRTGGYRHWAEKLELELKDSETKTGQDFELIIMSILEEKDFYVEKMSTKHPYDFLINGVVKVDVKVGHAYELKGSRCHTFGINKKNASCDIYIILALSENSDIERIFVIPSHKLKVVTMSIGAKTKYDKYLNNWELIDKYSNFFNSIE